MVGLFVFFFVFSLLFFFLAVSWQQEWRRRRIPMGVLSPFFYFFFIFFPNGAAPNTGGKCSARGRLRALLGIISSGFLYSLPKLQNNPRPPVVAGKDSAARSEASWFAIVEGWHSPSVVPRRNDGSQIASDGAQAPGHGTASPGEAFWGFTCRAARGNLYLQGCLGWFSMGSMGCVSQPISGKNRKSGALLQPLMKAQEFLKKFPKIATSLAAPFPLRGLLGL